MDTQDKSGKNIGQYDTVTVFFQKKDGSSEDRKYRLIFEDDTLDIAILGPIERKRSLDEYEVTALSIKKIASFREIVKGQTAFIAGYPFGIGEYGCSIGNPILQSGIVAFVDTVTRLLLIDVPVNYGNSGSPVYIVTTEGVAKLAGLVFAYQPNLEDWVIKSHTLKWQSANASLGRVVPLAPIIDKLRKLPH